MQIRWQHVNMGRCVATALVAGALFVALAPLSASAGERKPSGDKKTTSTAATAGFVVNLDASGKPVQAVPPQVVKKAPASRHEGLVVENNPAGGITVDLKGRFHRAVTATKDAQGRLHFDCQPVATDSAPTQGKE